MEGAIDVNYASLTSQGVKHRVFYLDGQPRRTGLNFGEKTGTGVFPFDSRTSVQMQVIHIYDVNT